MVLVSRPRPLDPSSSCSSVVLHPFGGPPNGVAEHFTAPTRLSLTTLSSRARSTSWFTLSVLQRSLCTVVDSAAPEGRFSPNRTRPMMRRIKPVTLFRLPSRIVQDRFSTQTVVVPFYFPSSRTLAFSSPPRRRSPEPTSSNRECVAWNASEISTGDVGYAAAN
jgi:hypothetical protein